ncbi:MAG: hypothetical protein V1775_19215 [Bacteroidota bacterium]
MDMATDLFPKLHPPGGVKQYAFCCILWLYRYVISEDEVKVEAEAEVKVKVKVKVEAKVEVQNTLTKK